MGVTEVDVDTGLDGELGVLSHFLTLVPGDALAEEFGQVLHFSGQECSDPYSIAVVGDTHQHHEPGGPFDQGGDLGAVALAEDEIAFPETRHGPISRLR